MEHFQYTGPHKYGANMYEVPIRKKRKENENRFYFSYKLLCRTVFHSNKESLSRDQLPPLNSLTGFGGD